MEASVLELQILLDPMGDKPVFLQNVFCRTGILGVEWKNGSKKWGKTTLKEFLHCIIDFSRV